MVNLKNGFMDVSGGHQLYWSEHGDPGSEPMLIIHGGSGFIFDMDKFTAHRGLPIRLIEIHQRGVGNSSPSGETAINDIDSNLGDLETLRSKLDIESWSIFSWSFGAVFMSAYALKHPERCDRLVSYAPYLGSEEDFDAGMQRHPDVMERYYQANNAESGEGTVRRTFAEASSPHFQVRFNSFYESMKLWDSKIEYDTLLASKTREEWERVLNIRRIGAQLELELFEGKYRFLEKEVGKNNKKIRSQVTLIYGGNDPWSGQNSYADRIFPNNYCKIVPDATHDVHTPAVQQELRRVLIGMPQVGSNQERPEAAFL